ncbi:MAG: polysaccharide biosynthesis protein, partial [Erysipelotrichaceae bacterium]|nr:polysaccharide biosynthesis protein [Erysipelotrichaceae bacterium]
MLNIIFNNLIYKKYRGLILCIGDLCVVILSFLLSYWARMDFNITRIGEVNLGTALIGFVIVLTVYTICFLAFKIYKSLWKYIGLVETLRIGMAVVCASAILIALVLLCSINSFYISIIFTAGLLAVLMMFNTRLLYRLLRRYSMKSGLPKENVVIIGAGDGGYILLKEILQNEKMHVNVVGFVDDQRVNKMISGYNVLGSTYDLPELVAKYHVTSAYIAIPSAGKGDLRRINDLCQSLKLKTKIMREADSLLEDELGKRRYPVEDISIEDLLGRGEIHLEQHEVSSYLRDRVVCV